MCKIYGKIRDTFYVRQGGLCKGKDVFTTYSMLNRICCMNYGYISWFFMKPSAKKVLLEDCLHFVNDCLLPIFLRSDYEKSKRLF